MRKPATGMWQFFESSCNGGVKIGMRAAAAARLSTASVTGHAGLVAVHAPDSSSACRESYRPCQGSAWLSPSDFRCRPLVPALLPTRPQTCPRASMSAAAQTTSTLRRLWASSTWMPAPSLVGVPPRSAVNKRIPEQGQLHRACLLCNRLLTCAPGAGVQTAEASSSLAHRPLRIPTKKFIVPASLLAQLQHPASVYTLDLRCTK